MASENNLLMDFASLSRSLGARHLSSGSAPGAGRGPGFSSVSIDSRTVKPGALFVALAGEKSDGHRFVEAAFEKGAAGAMVDSAGLEEFKLAELARSTGRELLALDNTLKGLQESARLYLEKFPRLLKIAITGSAGKSTTKEIAAAIIGAEKNTVMNSGNLNSETGLPLSVFEVRARHEVGIFELGTNRKGEIAELAAVLKPNIALITNIGSAHIGIFGSKGAIAEEKKNIFSRFTGNELALIPDGDEYRDFLARGVKGRVCFYGNRSFKELGGVKSLGLGGTEILWNGEAVRFALPGRHNLADAIAALAIAREIPVGVRAVKQGLEGVRPLFGRSEILEGPVTIIRDCYNANPESVEQALDFCDSLDWSGRRIYVIGDMLELGGRSREAHERVGRLLAASKADKVFLYGKETAAVMDGAAAVNGAGTPAFLRYTELPELSGALNAEVRRGDLVLLKASRGCALERLEDTLTGTAGKDAPSREKSGPGIPADKGGRP